MAVSLGAVVVEFFQIVIFLLGYRLLRYGAKRRNRTHGIYLWWFVPSTKRIFFLFLRFNWFFLCHFFEVYFCSLTFINLILNIHLFHP